MSGKVFLIFLSFLFIVSFKQYAPEDPGYQSVRSRFNRAIQLFDLPNATDNTDSICLAGFKKVVEILKRFSRSEMADSLLYQSHYHIGILCEVHNDFSGAKSSYLEAINYSQNPEQKLSMFIFAGGGYYKLNNFDSASFFLLQAEKNIGQIKTPENRIRLYNTLGVLYYDNGNYLQSKNYFMRALSLIETSSHSDALVTYSLRLNMATCFYKLGKYQQALEIYRRCLTYQQVQDPLFMNMGRAYAALHQYKEALWYFKKVNISVIPGVLNEMANTALNAGNPDSAVIWLRKFQLIKKTYSTNALDDGVNELYTADLDLTLENPLVALGHLQDALIIFSKNFTSRDIRINPVSFTGSFAYYRLFDVLVKKAKAWEMVYKKESRPESLKSAFEVYRSTITLLSYIERSYEMDDAKLLLKRNSGQVYMDALTVCLSLNKLYPQGHWLDSAFLISEQNRASVLGSQIRESSFLHSNSENDLTARERNIKFNIARLNAKSDEQTNAAALQKINDEKSVYETQLTDLRREMEGDSRFYRFKYADDFPTIKQLQETMSDDAALISFYNIPEKIELFVLTKSSLRHIELDSGVVIRHNIETWIQILENAESGKHVQAKALRQELYRQLVKPINGLAGNEETWIIVPDGLFFQLPVESLPGDEHGSFILENHTVSYEFSARFMMYHCQYTPIQDMEIPIFSLAPFSNKGGVLQAQGVEWLNRLPYSIDETSSLDGRRLSDHQATKQVFLNNLNRYPIVHLATHAMTAPDNPSASWIAFYPVSGSRLDDLLYLDEIYALRMDSCRLMVISACETGKGALVTNEGAMSFARAFLYAGCPSTINTLWKADDHSTSEILKSFYSYLKEGNSKPQALRKAKLAFIQNNPVNRNPAYWSHLILTGSPGSLYKKKQPLFWWAVLAISFGTVTGFFLRIRK